MEVTEPTDQPMDGAGYAIGPSEPLRRHQSRHRGGVLVILPVSPLAAREAGNGS